jgi:hypothetical protein
MSDARQWLAELQDEIRKQEAKTAEDKRFANKLCERLRIPPAYVITDQQENSVPLSIQADQFYGQPLAGAIRTILEMRRALKQGPAGLNDLYGALVAGGYKFETKNEENAKRGLRQSLTKNVAQFHKLPNGLFGLTEWYPKVKRRGEVVEAADAAATEAEDNDTGGEK